MTHHIPWGLFYVLLANQILMIVALLFGVRLLLKLFALSIEWRDALPTIKCLLARIDDMSKDTLVDLKTVEEIKKLDSHVDLGREHELRKETHEHL
jgi:hypothetical protein